MPRGTFAEHAGRTLTGSATVAQVLAGTQGMGARRANLGLVGADEVCVRRLPAGMPAAQCPAVSLCVPPCWQVLGALASVLAVWVVTINLLAEAVRRIVTPEPVDGKGEQLGAVPLCA